MERLPADDPDARSNGQASTSGASDQPTYLLVFPHRLLDFRIPELESVAELAGCKPGELKLLEPFGGEPLAPYWYMTVPSEDIAKKIAARAVLLKVGQLLHLQGAVSLHTAQLIAYVHTHTWPRPMHMKPCTMPALLLLAWLLAMPTSR